MTVAPIEEGSARKPLRLWPGVAAAVLLCVTRFVVPVVTRDAIGIAVFGGVIGGLAVLLWWLFFSRAPWVERLGAIVLMAAALFATSRVVHESIANGAMGMLLPILAIPVLTAAFVVWAVATRRLGDRTRRATMVGTIVLACGVFTLVRTGGVTGDFDNDLHWRWEKTPEERLLAETPAVAPAPAVTAAAPPAVVEPAAVRRESIPPQAVPDWDGFRGPRRDSVIRGVRIATDWSASPPSKLWRRAVGPGWSSFAVRGDLFYTQEQRGPDEIVACYRVSTGEPVWAHSDPARFWESNGGAGPRSTPALGDGRVYTLGATGIVNALDAAAGSVVWSRNAATDTETKVPGWGFSSSPLLFDDLVIVAASSQLVAYDRATGAPRWFGPRGRGSYSSPHLVTIDGVPQILLVSGAGAISVAPADGKLLWEHQWPSGTAIIQPALASPHDVLIGTSDMSGGAGIRRIAVAHGGGAWRAEERWTSAGLKPYYNDFVVQKGHAFGFDGSILSCIDLADGRRKWKGGRYGHGQLVLLSDQDLMLIVSEDGELALVSATPDQFREVAKVPAIDGKTWNHPVLTRDVLLVRNAEQMAAFRLAIAAR